MSNFNLKRATELAGLLGIEPTPPEDECVRVYSSEPVLDFWERLPDELPGGVRMSQSFIKKLLAVIDGEFCGKRLYATRILKEFEEATGPAAEMGHRFEYLVTGEQPAYGDKDASIPIQTKTGRVSAEDTRIQANAKIAREVLADFTADYAYAEAGREIVFKCVSGTTDVICYPIETPTGSQRGLVIDLKYSGLLDDKWSEFGWREIERKEGHKIQATHYTIIAEHYLGTACDFMFLVFDSRKRTRREVEVFGEHKPIAVTVTERTKNQHKHMILNLIEQYTRMYEGKKFTARPSYEGCADCPVETCKARRTRPEVENVTI